MFELLVDRSGDGIVPEVDQPAENRAPANDPEHIEAPKRIDLDNTLGWQSWLAGFGHRRILPMNLVLSWALARRFI